MSIGHKRIEANLKRLNDDPAQRAAQYRKLAAKNAGRPIAKMFEAQAVDFEAKANSKGARPTTATKDDHRSSMVALPQEIELRNLKAKVAKLEAVHTPAEPRMSNDELFAAGVHIFGERAMRDLIRNSGSDFTSRVERMVYQSGVKLPHSFSSEATKWGPPKEAVGLARIERAEQQRRVDAWLGRKK